AVDVDASDARDLGARDRPEVADDRERLERGLREPLLDRLLEQTGARCGCLGRGAEGPASRDVLEHDPARSLGVAVGQQLQGGADLLDVCLSGGRELFRGQRLRGDDEQRLDSPRKLGRRRDVDRDQAEWAGGVEMLHERLLSASAREILIGANGPVWASAISFCFRSSRRARNATAISIREGPETSWSKWSRVRRRSSERHRSRNWDVGGKRSAMCSVDGAGGSTARRRSASASLSGGCGASRRSGFGAAGAGPRRK